MKKQAIALFAAASLCLNLAIPAFSAEEVSSTEAEAAQTEAVLSETEIEQSQTEAESASEDDAIGDEILRTRAKIVFLQQLETGRQLSEVFLYISDCMEKAGEQPPMTKADAKIADDFIKVVDSAIILAQDLIENRGGDPASINNFITKWDKTKNDLQTQIDKTNAPETEAETEAEKADDSELNELEAYFDQLSLEEQVELLEGMLSMYDLMAQEAAVYVAESMHLDFLLDAFGLSSYGEASVDEMVEEAEAESMMDELEFGLDTRLSIVELKSGVIKSVVGNLYKLTEYLNKK